MIGRRIAGLTMVGAATLPMVGSGGRRFLWSVFRVMVVHESVGAKSPESLHFLFYFPPFAEALEAASTGDAGSTCFVERDDSFSVLQRAPVGKFLKTLFALPSEATMPADRLVQCEEPILPRPFNGCNLGPRRDRGFLRCTADSTFTPCLAPCDLRRSGFLWSALHCH